MIREPVVIAGLILGVGVALLLSQLRPVHRRSLAARLAPFGTGSPTAPPGALDFDSWREVIGPICRGAGERVARLFGVTEDVARRLDRLHRSMSATDFRIRQVGAAAAAMTGGALIVAALRPAGGVALLVVLGAPVLTFLVIEQRLALESEQWQRRVFLELPVITEQLAMLLTAGYSLGAALSRVSQRGAGACAVDMARVCNRVRQGLSEVEALREWTTRAGVPALDRLMPVFALNDGAADVGRLLSQEVRNIRAEVHREVVETMERRSQQVWIPVTVATLIPGVIFMAVPFVEALRAFSGS